jgi:hypothetical protein
MRALRWNKPWVRRTLWITAAVVLATALWFLTRERHTLVKVPFGVEDSFVWVKTPVDTSWQKATLPDQDGVELQELLGPNGQSLAGRYERLTTLMSRYPDREDVLLRILAQELSGMSQGPDQSRFLNMRHGWLMEQARLSNATHIQWIAALSQIRQGQLDSAQLRLAEILEQSPAFEPAYRNLAELKIRACQADTALELARWSVSLSHSAMRPQAYALLSRAFWTHKQLDSAKLVVEFALNQYPADTSLLAAKSQLSEWQGDLESARLTLEKWGTLHPKDSRPRLLLGTLGRNPMPQCAGQGAGRVAPDANSQADWAQLGALIDTLIREDSTNAVLYALAARYAILAQEPGRATAAVQAGLSYDSTDKRLLALRLLAERAQVQNPGKESGTTLAKSDASTPKGPVMFGEYLVPWGSGRADFFRSYDPSKFRTRDSLVFFADESFEGLRQRSAVLFDSTGLYMITGVLIDNTRNGDPLGRVLRHKSQNAGSPIPTENLKCGNQTWHVFSWETADQTEVVAQLTTRSWEVRHMRLWGKRRSGDEGLCSFLTRIEATTR